MREKDYLDRLIAEFVEIIKHFDKRVHAEGGMALNLEKARFENDFVAMNCDIQQIRSDNESLMDEIRTREESIKLVEHEICEAENLINIIAQKIREHQLGG